MTWATFHCSDRSYTLDDRDVLWLAKSLARETRDELGRAACAYTMLQRFLRWTGKRWESFYDLIRAFSQPVNPIWADPESAKCRQYPEACEESRIERRRITQAWKWDEIPQGARDVAVAFAAGHLANPTPDAVDFASVGLVRRQGKTGTTIGGNTFLDAEQANGPWRSGRVTVEPSHDIPAGGVDIDLDEEIDEPLPSEDGAGQGTRLPELVLLGALGTLVWFLARSS